MFLEINVIMLGIFKMSFIFFSLKGVLVHFIFLVGEACKLFGVAIFSEVVDSNILDFLVPSSKKAQILIKGILLVIVWLSMLCLDRLICVYGDRGASSWVLYKFQ